MNKYLLKMAGLKRELEFVDIGGDMAFASFVTISDTEMVNVCAPLLVEKIGPCDAIVTAEAKGIALAYEISKLLGHKYFVVARKSEKSYMHDTVSVKVHSITTKKEQILCLDGADAARLKGSKVCLLDDVVSTGDSLAALETLVKSVGAEVVQRACILAEGPAAQRKDIVFLHELPLFIKVGKNDYEVLK